MPPPEMPLRLLAFTALLAATSVAPAHAQSLADRLEEARVVARVQSALVADAELAPFQITAQLQGGVVRLRGAVETPAQRDRAAVAARNIRGVHGISNEIELRDSRTAATLPPPLRDTTPMHEAEATDELTGLEPAPPETRPATPPTTPPPAASPTPAQPAPAAAAPVYHQVRRGDTLGAIARQHGVTVQQIQRLNNLRGTNIRAGQRLRVK
jgi:hypothetical protein